MPLIHSSSEPAFKQNVETLMGEVGKSPHVKSRGQALAIAYATKRRGRAFGGNSPPWFVRSEARSLGHVGPIGSIVPGRTDNHAMHVPSGSYVLPADHVSSLGEGNSAAGMAVLNHMFGSGSPFGGTDMAIRHGAGAPRGTAPKLGAVAHGGSDKGGARGHQAGSPTPIMAAGGEYVIPPHVVQAIGHGDLKHGHDILDHWVVSNRKKHVKTLQKLPGPAKS